jgi:hypothetical protein
MPGSPLDGVITDGTTLGITDAVIAFGATALLTLLSAPMTKATKNARRSTLLGPNPTDGFAFGFEPPGEVGTLPS